MLKAVLFDMFDTLFLIEKGHAFYRYSLKKAHMSLVENGVEVGFAGFMNAYLHARDSLYKQADPKLEEPHFNLRISNALQSLGYSFGVQSKIVQGMTNAFCKGFMEYARIDENAETVLRELHGKYKLGIVSNFAIPECVTELLEKHNLYELFDVIMVSGAINKRKPSPEIFLKALEKLGVSPENALFVGDTIDADVRGAKNVGMKAIFIQRRSQEEVQMTSPDLTIDGLDELILLLKQS